MKMKPDVERLRDMVDNVWSAPYASASGDNLYSIWATGSQEAIVTGDLTYVFVLLQCQLTVKKNA